MSLIEIIKQHGYTVSEITKILGTNSKQIYRWNKEGILKSNQYYPILKEMFPELEGKEPKNNHASKSGPKPKEVHLTDTDISPPPEEIPTSSPFPKIKWNKPID